MDIRKILKYSLFGVVMLNAGIAVANEESDKFRAKAEQAIEKKDINTAIIHLKNGLKADAEDVETRMLLGNLYFLKGQYYKAEKEYEAILGRKKDDKLFILSLAESYQKQNKFDELLDKVHPGERGSEIESKILGIRGFAYLGKGQTGKAEELISEAVKLNPDDPNVMLWEVNLKLRMNELGKAEAALDRIIEKNPDFVPALVMKGNFAKTNNKLEEADLFYSRALEKQPENFQARLNRALVNVSAQKNESVAKDLDYLNSKYGKHPMVSYVNALVLSQDKKDDEATQKLLEMGTYVNEYAPALYLMGMLNYRNQRFEQAESNFRMLLGMAPNSSIVRIFLSNIYLQKNNPKKAVDVLNEVVDENTKDEQLLGALSTAYMRAGKPNEAAEVLERIVSIAPDNSLFQTRLALTKLQAGDQEKGIAELEKLAADNKDDLQLSMILAVSYIQANRLDEAEDVIVNLKSKMKDSPVPDNMLGAVYFKKLDIEKAEESFNKALSIKEDFVSPYINLAKIRVYQKDREGAREYLKKILDFDEKNLRAYMGLAELSLQMGKKKEVVDYLEDARDKNLENPRPTLALINFYLQEKDASKAMGEARKAVSKFAGNVAILDALGRAQLAANQPESAIDTYRKIVTMNKDLPMGYYRMAQAMYMAENIAGAKRNLKTAIEVDPNFMMAYRDLIQIALKEENYTEALAVAEEIKTTHKESSFGDMVAGDIYLQKKELDKALGRYQAGMKIQSNPQLLTRVYQAKYMQGNKSDAVAELEKWLKDHPEDPTILFLSAGHYLRDGESKKAIGQYEKLIKVSPENPMALNNLAWLYQDSDESKALAYGLKAYEIAPNSPLIADTYGWILVQKGDLDKGGDIVEAAAKAAEGNAEIQYHYAYVLYKKGEDDKAKEILERILSKEEARGSWDKANDLMKQIKN